MVFIKTLYQFPPLKTKTQPYQNCREVYCTNSDEPHHNFIYLICTPELGKIDVESDDLNPGVESYRNIDFRRGLIYFAAVGTV